MKIYRIIIESSISSAPSLYLPINIGGSASTTDDETILNSPVPLKAFSFFLFPGDSVVFGLFDFSGEEVFGWPFRFGEC